MKRLLSILLMNAWGGLRQKASLPTMSLVGVSVLALLVASTVTADASPHTNIPVVSTVAHAVRTSITDPISSILNETPPKPLPPKKPQAPIAISSNTQQQQQQSSNNVSSTGSTATPDNNSSSTASSANQSSSQPANVVIATSALQCSPKTSPNSYTVNVSSAQLNFQTPPVADGTITYAWDILSSNGQITLGVKTSQQQYTAGQTSVTLSPSPSSQTPYIYTTNSSTSSFSFRLHITGPFDATSSWVSVPVSADGTCPSSNG